MGPVPAIPRARGGGRPRRPPYRAAVALQNRTGGNPFFLEELVKAAGGGELDLRKLSMDPLPWELADTLRRQLGRFTEEGIDVVRVAAAPVEPLAERLADAIDERTAAVLVSSVLFETSRIVPDLDGLAVACAAAGVELLVDAYHRLGVLPMPIHKLGLGSAWIVGGGYKYLEAWQSALAT